MIQGSIYTTKFKVKAIYRVHEKKKKKPSNYDHNFQLIEFSQLRVLLLIR